jgi:CRP-like cAMP-binding protein
LHQSKSLVRARRRRGMIGVCQRRKGNKMISDTNILAIIRQHSLQQTLPAHTFLFQQGDLLREVYLLEKGLVKMTRGEQNAQEVCAR